jgi:putative hydrolase of the HAD superfamily
MKIEAILFDLGKVLVDFDMDAGVRNMLASCSLPREKFEEILWNKPWIRAYESGHISTEEFHGYLCRNASLAMELPQFCHTWSSIFFPGLLVSERLLAALKQRYRLVLVSNTNAVHAEYIRKNYSVFDYFDHHVLSFEVGSLKPDLEIFQHAIRAAKLPPGALFFTDDREENILAARSLGMRAHQFVSEQELILALNDAGVELGDLVHRDTLPS